MIKIISNGSKWYGQTPDTIEDLLKVLENEVLDPMYEDFGNFINLKPQWVKPEANEKYKNCVKIFGNFSTISHVFDIITDEQEIISKLHEAITNNKNTNRYKESKERYINKKNHNKMIREQFEKGELSSKLYDFLILV